MDEKTKIKPFRPLAAREFRALCQGREDCIYSPEEQLQRMLTVGQAIGLRKGGAGLLLLPLLANTALCAAVRAAVGGAAARGGLLITPVVGKAEEEQKQALLHMALQKAQKQSLKSAVWAVLECTPENQGSVPHYLASGLALRALQPLHCLTPCYLFSDQRVERALRCTNVPLTDTARLSRLLRGGWVASASRVTQAGVELELGPAGKLE